jgi:class 3 adenylate cyclase
MLAKERDLSVLFADVSGSVRLYEKLGDTAALQAVDRCLKRIERAVTGHQGRVVKIVGDELMAVFASVDDTFQAASEMQQSVSDLPLVSGVKLAIRVGFQQGSVTEERGDGSEDGSAGGGDVFGDCVNMAARLAGLAKPGQVLIGSQTQQALAQSRQMSTRDLAQMPVKSKTGEMQVFEVIWQTSADLALTAASIPTKIGAQLRVRYAGETLLLNAMKSAISMGRDTGCEVAVRDPRASRNHARIERRGEKFVLTDQSTNGTYITFSGEPELFLRREEVVLRGSGSICFAASATSNDTDCAEFELL